MATIKVLIVDDSSIMRNLLSALLSAEPDIEVVGTAPDPYVAREKLVSLQPDVMTLDIEMPKMDGISFLEKVMKHFPTRTIIISSLSTHGSMEALRAFELGAIDVIAKPTVDLSGSLNKMRNEIVARVRTAATAKIKIRNQTAPPLSPSLIAERMKLDSAYFTQKIAHQVVAIASSTGGIAALTTVLTSLPKQIPPILVVQHMPAVFTKILAEKLQRSLPFEIREATSQDILKPNLVLLAPGDFHMEVVQPKPGEFGIRLNQNPPLYNVRPAADYLLNSVAKHIGKNAVGVVLTGMGRDGAKGLQAMKAAGSFNIAQNEETCVVFGMPKVAITLGAIHKILPIEEIGREIIDYCLSKKD